MLITEKIIEIFQFCITLGTFLQRHDMIGEWFLNQTTIDRSTVSKTGQMQKISGQIPIGHACEAFQILKIGPKCCFVWKSGNFWNLLDNFLLSKSYNRWSLNSKPVKIWPQILSKPSGRRPEICYFWALCHLCRSIFRVKFFTVLESSDRLL
jgi:hypothetical protein